MKNNNIINFGKNILKSAVSTSAGTAAGLVTYKVTNKAGMPDEISIPAGIGVGVATSSAVNHAFAAAEACKIERELNKALTNVSERGND